MADRRLDTLLVQAGTRRDAGTGAISLPIHLSASFAHPALGQSTGYDYSRTGNPTRSVLEETMATAEGGVRAYAFASGMAGIDAVTRLFEPGDVLVATEDLYGGTFRLFERVSSGSGLRCSYVDTSDLDAVRMALDAPGVRGLFVESPTNPLLRVADVPALAALTRARGQLLIVDNTFLTPCLQRPLEQGADLVLYSATKYLAGHNDVVAGLVVSGRQDLAERLGFLQNSAGAILSPFDAWLTLRGLKTLPLRMRRHQDNALRIARWLQEHPRVSRVHYPGLETHPGHALLAPDRAFGGMVSFEVSEQDRIAGILAGVRLFLFAESLGGVESLITYPAVQTHADIPSEVRDRLGISVTLLRLSVGIEDAGDLIRDLDAVL